LPVLRKDFLISDYQIYESGAMGADAVLLICRILSRRQLTDLLALSRSLGMDALVEIHTMEDLEMAQTSGARLIGINNRNLATFETDIRTAMVMAQRAVCRADSLSRPAGSQESRTWKPIWRRVSLIF
jgi:indole-3-glycerol phosphate synthase